MIEIAFYKETDFKETETEFVSIPRDWRISRLEEIIWSVKGRKPHEFVEESQEGCLPYLSTEYLRNNEKSKQAMPSASIITVENDDLILLWDGSNAGEFFMGKKGILSSTMVKLELKSKDHDRKFLFYILKTKEVFLKTRTKGTGIPHVDRTVLEHLPIPLPPLQEQQRISEVLSNVDEAIKKTGEIIAKIECLKKGMIQKLLTEGMGHKEYKQTPIGEIPKEWEVKSLEEVCTTIVDCPHTTPKFMHKGVLIVRNFNIREGELVLDAAHYTTEDEWQTRTRRCIPENDDVLFSREAPIGEACLAPKNTRFSLGQRTMLLRPDKRLLNPLFLVYVFYSPLIRRKLRNLEAGVTAHHVNVADIRSLKIPIPNLSEQEKISSIISTVVEKLKLHRKENAKLGRVKQGLMDLLLFGRIRIKVK